MSYRREIPTLNKDNFKAWQELMKLHLGTIGDTGLKFLQNKYVEPPISFDCGQMVDKKNHNTMMIDIASAPNYAKFDEFKYFPNNYGMWNKL